MRLKTLEGRFRHALQLVSLSVCQLVSQFLVWSVCQYLPSRPAKLSGEREVFTEL